MLNNKADKALSAHSGPSLEHIISSTGRPIKVQELQDRVEDLKSRKNAFKEEYMVRAHRIYMWYMDTFRSKLEGLATGRLFCFSDVSVAHWDHELMNTDLWTDISD